MKNIFTKMKGLLMRKFIFCILVTIISVNHMACAPSAQQRTLLKTQAMERQAALSARRSKLALQAQQRIAKGEAQPPKPKDPGYAVAICKHSDLNEDVTHIYTGFPLASFICSNTTAGDAIVQWRKWYCQGEDANCTLSSWEDGNPSFGFVLEGTSTVEIGNELYRFESLTSPGGENQFRKVDTSILKEVGLDPSLIGLRTE